MINLKQVKRNLDTTEEGILELEEKSQEITQNAAQRDEKLKKSKLRKHER